MNARIAKKITDKLFRRAVKPQHYKHATLKTAVFHGSRRAKRSFVRANA